jgi:hypothetical protein
MQIGERYSLAWKHPHRLEATIVALESDHVVCEVDHRCGFACHLKAMKNTLPIEGRMIYRYDDFAKLFVQMNTDAIPLPA